MANAADDFVAAVQALLKKAERHQAIAGRTIDQLHEKLAAGLEQFGPGAGCDGDVVASIITPKNPPK